MKLVLAHASLQFSDPDRQHTEDVEALFARAKERNYAWITGTESGPGAGNTTSELLRVGRANGYRMWVPSSQKKGKNGWATDCWIAVRSDLIHGNPDRNFVLAIPGSKELQDEIDMPEGKRWGPKGLVSFAFDNDQLGRVNIGAAHYLTDARSPRSPYWVWNKKLASVIGDWARTVGAGSANLAFYAGDQNMADSRNDEPQGDTFFGEPLTSAWDELGRWENTGHGCIDVIASYDGDGRVVAKRAVALDDDEFFLHTDHFLIEAVFDVREIVPPPPLKPIEVIAQEVIDGLWGNGEERRTRLTTAGYNYDEVQAKVAELLAPKPVEHSCPACGNVHTGVVSAPSR